MSNPYAAFLPEFLSSAEELVARIATELERLRAQPQGGYDLTALMRAFHSLKGNSSFVPDSPLTPLAHAAEDAVEAARDGFVAPARLLDPLAATLDCFQVRLEEYRRTGEAGPSTERERDLATNLSGLAAAEGERGGPSSRYFFAGEDVTETMILINGAERGGADSARLLAIRDRLCDLAAAADPSGAADLNRDGDPDPRQLLRWLAERAVRVPVVKAKPKVRERPAASGDTPRGGLVPRHFTVDAGIVDEFLEHAVELRLFGERLARLDRKMRELAAAPAEGAARAETHELEEFAAELRAANHAFTPLAGRLQERLLAIRRVPVRRLLDRHAAMIRELGPRLGKEVAVVIEGDSTRADKSIVEQLEPPLTHMVRNAVDHGLEILEERAARGKPARGTITLRASSEGQWFVLEVGDDGAGVNAAALRRSAIERGFLDSATAAGMSDAEVMDLVYLPGLSSRREVDDLSGRGVGMDEVSATVRQLRGTIRIQSAPGEGTTFFIKVPDTGFAVVRCVPVKVGELRFLIPHDSTRHWTDSGIDPDLDGPLIDLARVAPQLVIHSEPGPVRAPDPASIGSNRRLVVVLESGGRRFGLQVDEVGREIDVVVRPLDRELVRAPLWSMAALGDEGETRLVIDVDGLAALLPGARARSLPPAVPDAA